MTDKTQNELTNTHDENDGSVNPPDYAQQRIEMGGKEVFAPTDQPFETAAKTVEKGPLFIDADELDPELAERSEVEDLGVTEKTGLDRRDFMRMFGATAVIGTGAAACVRRPEEVAIPYVTQQKDQVPGRAVHYMTTCGECTAGCGVMVKTREGRPVKLEGSNYNAVSQGALCSLGQASIQGLYHPERRKAPQSQSNGQFTDLTWDEALKQIGEKIPKSKNVAILTNGSTGNRHGFYRHFLKTIGSQEDRLYTYESNGYLNAVIAAHKIAFGASAIPRADLRRPNTILGIGADFLDIGASPVYYHSGFSSSQFFSNQTGSKGKFIQCESLMTLTGARADERYVIPPGQEMLLALALIDLVAGLPNAKGTENEKAQIKAVLAKFKSEIADAPKQLNLSKEVLESIAKELLATSSIVMVGGTANDDVNATNLQLCGIMLNILVGAYGPILFFEEGYFSAPVVPGDMQRFLADAAQIDLLIVIDINPAFTLPKAHGFADAVSKIATVVSIQPFPNETDLLAHFALPAHHYLESWGDEQPVGGYWTFRQPTIRPTMNSRQAEDILFWIAAHAQKSLGFENYHAYLLSKWADLHKLLNNEIKFDLFLQFILRKGVLGKPSKQTIQALSKIADKMSYTAPKKGLVLLAPQDYRLRDGRGAHLPLLQEVGDSLTTIAWDSWVTLNPAVAKNLGLKRNDLIKIDSDNGSIEVPLFPMPGIHPQAVVVARGNGHRGGFSKVNDLNGVDPLPLMGKAFDPHSGVAVTAGVEVRISNTGKKFRLAAMQKHNDIANRTDIVRMVSVEEARSQMRSNKDRNLDEVPDLYPKVPSSPDYRWGMAIDLGRCTGCSACMVACSLENNVPQIGRVDIVKGREMHWIRLDRYFSGPAENPMVTFQPMMCQQCNQAPCEAVCPVYATTHDPEGINAMTYNRCVGTRYCGNACPYKVRRFNWWTHKWDVIGDRLQDRNPRALNPDVTVRTRGVMEKCNFCYQRVRAAKHEYKYLRDNERVRDGTLQTACQQACPTAAIVFGNLNDKASAITNARKDGRAYLALGGEPEKGEFGLKTLPNVSYLSRVTLKEVGEVGGEHGAKGKEHS